MATPIRGSSNRHDGIPIEAYISLDGVRQYPAIIFVDRRSGTFSGELPLELLPPASDMDLEDEPVPA